MRVSPDRLDPIVAELERIVGEAYCTRELADLFAYSTDYFWVPRARISRGLRPQLPDVIVHPGTPEEIGAILRLAGAHLIPVIPWGGGSGTQGGVLPIYGGITLDLKRLDRIVEIDERSLVVRAQAGIIGQQLEWALNARGITLAHYPASIYCATLGGYLACRGSGVLSTKYGKAEDMVLSLQVVLPTGEVVRTPATRAHACGPDLNQVFVGSEGTLGVITEATMRCDPLPDARLFRGVLFPSLHGGLEAGRQIMIRRLTPSVIRLYDENSTRSIIRRILNLEAEGAYMILVFEGDPDLTALQQSKALEICRTFGATDIGEEPGRHWWEHRYDFYYPTLTFDLPQLFGTTDTVATFANIEGLYRARKQAIEEGFAAWNVRYLAHFSHWYPWGAMLYDRFVIDEPPADFAEALALHDGIWDVAVNTALQHGGVLNEHHGVGLKLGRFMKAQYGDAFKVIEAIKQGLDPQGIMNPGKQGLAVTATMDGDGERDGHDDGDA